MTCAELRLRLDDYVGGRLSDAEAAALESHLESCAACEALLESEAAPVDAIRSLPRAVSPREDLWPGIGARLTRREPGLRRRVAVPRWVLAAAAVLLVAVSSGATALLLNREPSRLPVRPVFPSGISGGRVHLRHPGARRRAGPGPLAAWPRRRFASIEQEPRV